MADSGLPGRDTGHALVIETDAPLARRCAERGLLVGDLVEGWSGGAPRRGIILDYGGHEPEPVRRALRIVVALL